jgi:hypothetical protein
LVKVDVAHKKEGPVFWAAPQKLVHLLW